MNIWAFLTSNRWFFWLIYLNLITRLGVGQVWAQASGTILISTFSRLGTQIQVNFIFLKVFTNKIYRVSLKKRTFKDFKERLCQIIQNYILFSCDFMRANEFREKESKIDPIYFPPIKTFKKHTLCYDLRKRFFVFYLFTHGFTTIGGDGKP